jgi:GTPase SAR1 family protein
LTIPNDVTLISQNDLDQLLAQINAESWTQLVLLGPLAVLPAAVEDWPEEIKLANQIFQLKEHVDVLATKLQSLASVTSLNLWGNNIGEAGAKELATLTALTSLDLRDNTIGDAGAKELATLTALTSLDLRNNTIGEAGAKELATLTALTSLDLGGNTIGEAGLRKLLETWVNSPVAWQLQTLNLRNNRDLRDLVPSEILETTDAQAILAAYRRYRAADEQKTLRPLNEAKLLVVGNEAVGKTSLLRYLINGKPRDPNEKKTPGIATHEKIETHTWLPKSNSKRCEISLNVWDFGGQEMMRGTHRFFLTERSLYLLVLEDRRQDDESSAENWLKTAVNCGGLSPIIVVINKSDSGKEDLRLNQARLHRNYPNIVGFLRTSCESDDWAAKSIETLRELIATTIAEHSQLKHVRDPFPESYLRVKKAITELASKNSVLSHSQFERICEGGGVARDDEAITDPDEQRALLRLLHDLGTVVAQGLERNAPAAVREITLLDPNWLTGAVYRLLNEPMVRDQEGEFKRDQLNLWLDPKLYPPERHEFILTMMQDPDIGLCFRLPDAGGECYLIPEALRASEPDYDNWPTNSLHFRYIYQYLPSSLIPRFIVQAHRHLTGKKTRWRTGVVLSVRNCRVLIRGDLNGRRIDISVDGPDGLRRSALNVVLDDLEVVHELNPECAAEARVPLPDQPEKDVGYNHLLTLEEEEGSEYRHRPDGAGRAYTVQELLHGVRRNQTRLEPAKRSEPSEFAKHPSPQTNSVKKHVVILVHGIRTQALCRAQFGVVWKKKDLLPNPPTMAVLIS